MFLFALMAEMGSSQVSLNIVALFEKYGNLFVKWLILMNK